MDSGGGFMKVTLNLIEKRSKKNINTGRSDKHTKSRHLDSSVKHLLLLAVCEGIPEDYDNIKTILEKLQLNTIGCNYVSDIKMINVSLGLMSASSNYPCPYCEIYKDFKNPARKRTVGRIK